MKTKTDAPLPRDLPILLPGRRYLDQMAEVDHSDTVDRVLKSMGKQVKVAAFQSSI